MLNKFAPNIVREQTEPSNRPSFGRTLLSSLHDRRRGVAASAAAYFDIFLLHIIYSILIGGEREGERERGARASPFEKLCHAAMFARMEKCRALCGRATKRRRRGERCHYVKFGITTGFPAQIGVKVGRGAGHSLGLGSTTQCPLDNFSHTIR